MSDTPWTPGPWPIKPTGDYKRILVGVGLVDGPRGYDVAEVYSDDCDHDEAMANARLIAAAPDLFAALDDLWGWVREWGPDFMDDPEFDRSIYDAALAKAKGETS